MRDLGDAREAVRAEASRARPVCAFAATLNIAAAFSLIDQIGSINAAIVLDDLLIKAIACALDQTDLGQTEIVWRDRGEDAHLSKVARLTLSRVAEARRSAGRGQTASGAPRLLVSRIREPGLRPALATLASGVAMRLTLAGAGEGPMEALLTYDEDLVAEPKAARLLGALRTGLATPLRLLV